MSGGPFAPQAEDRSDLLDLDGRPFAQATIRSTPLGNGVVHSALRPEEVLLQSGQFIQCNSLLLNDKLAAASTDSCSSKQALSVFADLQTARKCLCPELLLHATKRRSFGHALSKVWTTISI